MAYVRYRLYFWNPPILTLMQEIDAGRQIVMDGGPEAWKKRALYLPPEERPTEGDSSPKRRTLAILILLGFLAIVILAGPFLWIPLGIACITVLPLSMYTLFAARKRYHSWVDKVVDAYLLDAERAIGLTRLSDEEHMRVSQKNPSNQQSVR